MTDTPPNEEMIEGYLDGLEDAETEYPNRLSNRSRSYCHGWLNGRDDRMRSVRASASDLRELADEAMAADKADLA